MRAFDLKHQRGASLIEIMVGLALSLIVTTAMVMLMGNSLGSATRIIQMSQLTDELRNTMSLMSRDVRRSNYNVNAMYCFANAECGDELNGSAIQADDIFIKGNASGTVADTCILFGLDRDWDGNANNDGGGAFRGVVEDGVGRIEMWVGSNAPACDAGNDWISITDPDLVNITHFLVDDSANTGSFSIDLEQQDASTLTQRVRSVHMEVGGELNLDGDIQRMVVDRVKVRNDYFAVN